MPCGLHTMVSFDQDYPIIIKFPFLQPDCTDSRASERTLIDGIFTNYIQNRKLSTCVGAYLNYLRQRVASANDVHNTCIGIIFNYWSTLIHDHSVS